MVLNVDLGFILSLVDFFSLSDAGMILEVRHDIIIIIIIIII